MSLGVVFPGQGAQSVGMLADVSEAHPAIAERFDEAGDVLGLDLRRIVAEGPEADLNRTDITQPALLTASVAVWQLLDEQGADPVAFSGHSLGEYSALVAAQSIKFADAVKLVNLRGQLMQRAVPLGEGAMAAILGLEDSQIADACNSVDGVVSPANFNAPGQVVIAGAKHAVESAAEACKAAGAKRALILDVSVPSHCALMASIADEFAAALDDVDITLPSRPVIHNVNAQPAADLAQLRANLVAQLASPVRWTDCVGTLQAMGVSQLVECGPANVLSGLVKRIDRSLPCQSTGTLKGLDAALELLTGGAA